MAGYQTIEALRPILHRGPPATPVLDRALFYKPRAKNSPTCKQVREMVALREQCVSLREIAKQFRFARCTVFRHVGHIAPPPGGWPKGGRKSTLKREFGERLRRAGFSYQEIADELGCSKKSAQNLIKGPRETDRKGGRERPTKQFEDVVSWVTGYTVQQLRRKAGGSQRPAGDKARLLLQWLVRHKRPNLSFQEIGKLLGGYDPSTCVRAHQRVQAIVEDLKIDTGVQTQRVVRALWEAEWPKASA